MSATAQANLKTYIQLCIGEIVLNKKFNQKGKPLYSHSSNNFNEWQIIALQAYKWH